MRFRERLFEGQLLSVRKDSLQRKAILVDWVPSITPGVAFAAGCYAIAELFDLGDVSIVPTGDEVLIALTADAMLAHNFYKGSRSERKRYAACRGYQRFRSQHESRVLLRGRQRRMP